MSRSPFSYAVVRVVPDIERQEFLNAGLILFCRPQRFLRVRTTLDVERLRALRADCDVDAVRAQLQLFERIADGEVDAGPFAQMDQSQRFHWLSAARSTTVQPGPIHGGTTDDAAATFEDLYRTLVEA